MEIERVHIRYYFHYFCMLHYLPRKSAAETELFTWWAYCIRKYIPILVPKISSGNFNVNNKFWTALRHENQELENSPKMYCNRLWSRRNSLPLITRLLQRLHALGKIQIEEKWILQQLRTSYW